ncbi:MAG: hypothetical protein IBX71_10165 [Candidatus Desulforudis sp.]|nr:hypothetical protein [Desulforudis sp.]
MVLASPLYVDSPPYIVMRTMELIAAHRKATAPVGRPLFLAISNCGFPEAHHNDTALAIYRRFAREVGLDWAGGLALGAGESIAGRELAEAGGMVHKVRRALELSADALADGEAVPPEAVKLMAAPLMPLWLYLWGGNWGWKRQARNNGVLKSIKDRPYL